MESIVASQQWLAPRDISGADSDESLVKMWLASHRSPHTRRAYASTADRLFSFFRSESITLRTATVRHLIAWTETCVGKPATRARHIGAMKSLFAYAARLGYSQFDVGAVVQVPRIANQLAERIVDEDTVRQIWNVVRNSRDRVFVRFLYVTGARISETCSMQWDHLHRLVSGDYAVTLHGKGGLKRTVLLPASIYEELVPLRGNRSEHDPVFTTRHGTAVTPGGMRDMLRRACSRANVRRITPHWLRHAHASHALDNGAPISLVQAQLGHASLATTGKYTHARPTDGSGKYLDLKERES